MGKYHRKPRETVKVPEGRLAKVKIDFDTLKTLSLLARVEYGLARCIQYGASTFPEEDFAMFPKVGAAKIHLAEGFQNITYDNPLLVNPFREEVYEFVRNEFACETKEG